MSATTAWSGSGLRSTASGGLSGHAEHGRVDEQIRLAQVRRQMRPRRRLGRAAKMRSQRLGSTLRSVDDRDALKPARLERVDDRPGGAAGADDDGQFRSPRPAGRAVVHVGQKAGDVGVVAPQKPVLPPERVHRPERLGDRRSPVADAEGCFLVRRRHVSADELVPADPDRELARILPAGQQISRSFPKGRAPSASDDESSAIGSGPPASPPPPRGANES